MSQTIGIIGAGQMGNGIAHVCAVAGYQVKLVDLSQEQLDKGLEAIRANLARQHKKGLIQEKDISETLARISTSTVSEFPECDLVIEAATEDESIKRKIFSAICPTLKPEAIL
ncbi:MAG: 3-hydroxybutyryl-CoA dehydrogenase, partial [Alphaproteobacteria bacterium]|nr:3-hydroxybutyryl-CoA dehydrogenase [Alphaproteobacteria bacterium]